MNVKQIALILVALIIAGGSFVLMKRQTATPATTQVAAVPQQSQTKMVKILVTNRDYVVGDRIVPSSLIWQDWPQSANVQSFILQSAEPKAAETMVDAVVTVPMFLGEPVVKSKLVIPGETSGIMAALLTPGMRATTVNVTPDSSVAGFILPNNRVDVLLTRQIQFQTNGQTVNRTVSSTILENVRVLAIDQNTAAAKEQKAVPATNATLELSPADAEKLKAADSLGDISLLLRSYADTQGPTISNPNALAMAQPRPVTTTKTASAGVPAASVPAVPQTNPNPQPSSMVSTGVKIYRGGQ